MAQAAELTQDVAERMADAAGAWLASLGADQRAVGLRGGPDDGDRLRWFYTPTDHGGLTFHQQRPAQQRLAMRLVAAGLSEAGYNTVATVIGLENVLDRNEGFRVDFGRERGRDPGMYHLRVFGTPGPDATWGWRFGGHHVSLNNLVVAGRVVATTPCFLGANPAAAPLLGGAGLRPLGAVEDMARELMRSLPPDLAEAALLLPHAPADIVTGNSSRIDGVGTVHRNDIWRAGPHTPDGAADPLTGLGAGDLAAVAVSAAPKGVPATALDPAQRELLRTLIGAHLDRVPAAVSPVERYGDPAVLDAVHFAWAGSTAVGDQHYFRVQGPRLLVEWDNTQEEGNHAHSVWRDPEGDFGQDALAAHVAAHHSTA